MGRFLRYGPSMAIAMILLMAIGYAGVIVAVDYKARHSAVSRDLREGLDNFASATRSYFRSYEAVVTAVSESDCVRSRGRRACDGLFERLNRRFPDVVNFAGIGRDGRFFASGQPFPPSGPPDASARPFFTALAGGGTLYVMDPHTGPVTGETVVGFTVPLRDDSGVFDGVIGISTRFSELQTQWERGHRAAADIAILLLDRDRRVIFASPGLALLIGLPEVERARVIAELAQPEGSVVTTEGTWLFMAEDLFDGAWRVATFHPGPYFLREYLKDGGVFPYLLLPIILLGAFGFVMVHRDWRSVRGLEDRIADRTAELAATNQELRLSLRKLARRNDELNMFATVSSHDLREPLRAVSTFVSMIERRYGELLDADGRAYIGFARDGANRANRVILDLLAYTEAGHCAVEPRVIAPSEVAARAVGELGGLVAKTNADIVIDPVMPPLFLCEEDLLLLFLHLTDNALKHRHPERRPTIRISAWQNDGEWIFCVEDSGAGIEPQYFDKVFVLFQRLDPRNAPEGSGIGLTICGKIVDKYGGRIWIESEPGSGSRFLFTLPEAREASPADTTSR